MAAAWTTASDDELTELLFETPRHLSNAGFVAAFDEFRHRGLPIPADMPQGRSRDAFRAERRRTAVVTVLHIAGVFAAWHLLLFGFARAFPIVRPLGLLGWIPWYVVANALPAACACFIVLRVTKRFWPDPEGQTRCGTCGYFLHGVGTLRCPECGTQV